LRASSARRRFLTRPYQQTRWCAALIKAS